MSVSFGGNVCAPDMDGPRGTYFRAVLRNSISFNQFWPASRSNYGKISASPFEPIENTSAGVFARKLISGITRDAANAPLAGATVKLYTTAADASFGSVADQVMDTVVSAADGAYTVGTPLGGNHYVTAYKAGSPDVAGTTKNTLVGA